MIPLNAPPIIGTEIKYIKAAMGSGKLCGDGGFTLRRQQWLENSLNSLGVLLTPFCTVSLEIVVLLLDTKPSDEVTMLSFAFVSTVNAFVLRGAKIVFIDTRPDSMNIDEIKIKAAITKKNRAVVPIHFSGEERFISKVSLSLFYNMSDTNQEKVISTVQSCFI